MPYTGPGDPKLPDNIKKLSETKRNQFVGAFNGRYEACKKDGGATDACESSAFAVANAAVKEASMVRFKAEKNGAYDEGPDTWDFYMRQVYQSTVNYKPAGGGENKACSNCQWFMSPDACVVVESWPDNIAPNGLSDLWRERAKPGGMEPMEVIIVGERSETKDEKSMLDRIKALINGWNPIKPDTPDTDTGPTPGLSHFAVYKDTDDAWRWVAWASNKFRDRDEEIITESAHKEFVSYLDNGGTYPEAWLWHTPGTKWGQADWVDYADGFLIVSGIVDADMYNVAESLSKDTDLGVSHGFHFKVDDRDKSLITHYRTFEVSPLPLEAAANVWTGINVLKEADMELTEAKRKFLVDKLGEDRVKQIEAQGDDMAKAIDGLDIDWKEFKEPEPVPQIDVKAIGEAAASAVVESEAFKALGTGISEMDTKLKTLTERVDKLEKTDDDKVDTTITARIADAVKAGFQASKDTSNETTKEDPLVKENEPIWDFVGTALGGTKTT